MRKCATKATLFVTLGAVALAGASATAANAATATDTAHAKSALLTIQAFGEQYKVRANDPAVIKRAVELMKNGPTENGANIPHGQIVKGASKDNPAYSTWRKDEYGHWLQPWHINPANFKFSEVSSKGCDEAPSDLWRNNIAWKMGYLCPWGGKVVKVQLAE
ncbi:hypothetical protein AB0N09_17860 [Streptomyces erythrochromogenes]|uniref:BP74-related protein n=1 Tax=Streptomyces erythrochromogenes TaxID=285574 RepID=UPI003421E523